MTIGDNIGMIGDVRGPIVENSKTHRQVYRATHLNDGRSDSFMNRSFISFSYGGKNIEDFNLIACINGDRMERQLTGNFNDLITNYDIIDGQYYWGTYFSNNEMSFTLVTDGITQPELDDFIHWFTPGQVKELILAEHPNRAIMARVANPPTLSTIPFEEKINFSLDGRVLETSTTLYKGEIQLQLIMDSPFWYSKMNLLVNEDDERGWVRELIDANGESVSVIDNKDALKIIYEDKIPTLPAVETYYFDNTFFLGNNLFFKTIDNRSIVGWAIVGITKLGYYSFIPEWSTSLEKNNTAYLYYAGIAPEYPKLSFNYKIIILDNKINTPKNCNTITFTCTNEQKLLLGMPSVFYGYNIIIDLFNDTSIITFGAMREKIREKVHHYYVKKWASAVLNYVENAYNNLQNDARAKMIDLMRYFLLDKNNTTLTNTYYLDGELNKYIGILGYRITENILPLNDSEWASFGQINEHEEDISEIIKSKYLVLSERNHLNSNHNVQPWSEEDPTLSYKVTHDFDTTLNDFVIIYKNKYY